MPTEDGKMTIAEVRDNARMLWESLGSRQDEDAVWQRAVTVLVAQLAGRCEEISAQMIADAEDLKRAVAAGIKRLTEATERIGSSVSGAAIDEPTDEPTSVEAAAAAEIAQLPAEVRPGAKAKGKPKADVPVAPLVAPPANGDPAAIAAQMAGAGGIPPAPLISSTVKG